MRTYEDVMQRLTPILVESLGVEPEEIKPAARFEADLGGESIGLLDFSFRCEKQFGVRLDFQNLVRGEAMEIDSNGRLTPESLSSLKARYPFLDYSEFEKDPRKAAIGSTITVESLAHFVCEAMAAKEHGKTA
jgi:acyl carrier protein